VSVDAWKCDDKVRLASGQKIMVVLGYDSVGSVICRPLDDDRHGGLHVPPSSLVAATEE
jgi:uncharacterized protein YodC (DUF2158 family)